MTSPLSRLLPCFAGLAGAAALMSFAPAAEAANLDACGDIFLEADAQCEVLAEGGCKAECEPPSLTAACAAEGTANCSGECNAEIQAACTTDCSANCVSECEVDPPAFECAAACEGRCAGDCSAQCEGSSDRAECEASCEATCSANCEASCEATPPEADCNTACEASCTGSCQAEANMDCQIDCQSSFYATCKADLQGECELHCERPQGALFCDGQFVSAGDLDSCVNALREALDVEVRFEAEASGSATLSCAVDEQRRGAASLIGLGLLCLAAIGRRRQR